MSNFLTSSPDTVGGDGDPPLKTHSDIWRRGKILFLQALSLNLLWRSALKCATHAALEDNSFCSFIFLYRFAEVFNYTLFTPRK